jgi:predicted acetyltransferase
MDHEIRPISESEIEAFRAELTSTFGGDLSDEERADDARFRELVPLERTRAAFAGEQLVGTLGDIPFEVTVPGGRSVPMAGTTMVTVRPTHTRQGILRALMTSHLQGARDLEQPLAGLWASDTRIYGRFGFGPATDRLAVKLLASAAVLRDDAAGSVRRLSADEALELLPSVHEQVRATTPGVLSRSATSWKWRLYDPEAWRQGMSARRLVVFDGESGPEGFATYRLKEDWNDSTADGKVAVNELQAATPAAHLGLWRYLTSVDLFPNVSYWNTPVDDPLRWLVKSPRLVELPTKDALWIRILDVIRALEARRYSAVGELRLEVADQLYPDQSGTYELSSTVDGSHCGRVRGAGQIEMDAATLGMIYLGGRNVTALARAGLVKGEPDAVALADAMFSWPQAPWCPEVF